VASSSASEARTALEARGFGYAYAGASRTSLDGVELAVAAGECVWLRGPSGSGKTTLLRGLAGVLPPGGRSSGRVRALGRPALLFQDVESQLLCTTVDEEVELGLRERGVPADGCRALAREALARVGIAGFERRPVDALSAGEKQRVVLAALLALRPRVLLLDEPASALDPAGRRALVALLRDLARSGHAVMVADHTPDVAAAVADRRLELREGRLTPRPGAPDAASARREPAAAAAPGPGPRAEALRCESVGVVDSAGRALLDEVSLVVRRGERALLTGPNGAGKTTLLRAAAGLAPLARGRVHVAPRAGGEGGVGLLFQDPQRHLFAATVADEVAFALRRQGLPRRAVEARVAEVLDLCDLAPLRQRSPLRLAFGEQIRVALAAALAPRPALLLLDEPFAGLDSAARARLLGFLAREQAQRDHAIVIASHDPRPWEGWCSRTLRLSSGRLCDE
jgi:energy-coupling factor transport system ATP-binding protein